MLSAITLDGFRCFAEPTRVTFGNLTVLAGANSAGKSSVLHAMLSLVQSDAEWKGLPHVLRLSGGWVEIGGFKQALNYSRQGNKRSFSIGVAGQVDGTEMDIVWIFDDPGESAGDIAKLRRIEACIGDKEIAVEPLPAGGAMFRWYSRSVPSSAWLEEGFTPVFGLGVAEALGPLSPGESGRFIACSPETLLYLSAFRDLPRKLYPRRRSNLGPLLGAMGEYVAETLFTRRNVMADVLPTEGPPPTLGAALEAWWAHIFGGDYSIRTEAAGEDLGFTLALDTPSAENLRLTQVGTGLSQALPVIVLGLCSKPGDLVIVESPEVQLHPAAQHRLMDLFVALVRSGRQVILETHSDHIIHAAQLAVKSKRVSPEELAMRFFSQEAGVARVENVPVDEHGRMQKQPIGFVDQASADLLELIR